jgi:DNA-binding winged helix-turn-helix (wHTH) protein
MTSNIENVVRQLIEEGFNKEIADVQQYEVGPFRVDPVRRRLYNGDVPVSLTPKVFGPLLAFVERPGTLLSKDDLLQLLWPDVAVEENNLTHCIAKLRRALGDDIRERRFIVTCRVRGIALSPQCERSPRAMTAPGWVNGLMAQCPGTRASPDCWCCR